MNEAICVVLLQLELDVDDDDRRADFEYLHRSLPYRPLAAAAAV